MTSRSTRCLLAALAVFAAQTTGAATNRPSVVDGGGCRMAGGSYSNVCACAQPSGIAPSVGGVLLHYAGFLGGFSLRPALDTDGDGLPDELDADNDGDTLADEAELDGSAFGGWAATDPNRRDTDGDGMSDVAEAVGLYDPNDPGHRLEIVAWRGTNGQYTLTWIGKGGGWINTISAGEQLANGGFTNILHSAAYPGGEPPWFKATNAWVWTEGATSRFYRVHTQP